MYLALADGAAGFIQDFTGPVLLRIPLPPRPLRLPAFHRLWGCFPGSFDSLLVWILWSYNPPTGCPVRVWAGSRSLATTWDITIVFFSSGYLDVSVPPVRFPVNRNIPIARDGFPHSDTRGSTLLCSSPQIFAA